MICKLRIPLHLRPLRQPQHEVHPYPNVLKFWPTSTSTNSIKTRAFGIGEWKASALEDAIKLRKDERKVGEANNIFYRHI